MVLIEGKKEDVTRDDLSLAISYVTSLAEVVDDYAHYQSLDNKDAFQTVQNSVACLAWLMREINEIDEILQGII